MRHRDRVVLQKIASEKDDFPELKEMIMAILEVTT